MSEFSDVLGIVGAIVGIVIGFMLSQFTIWSKNRQRKNMIRKALTHELKIVEEILLKAKDNTIPAQDIPLITETYDAVKVELASFLEPFSLATVQKAYQEIKKLNQPLESTPEGYTIQNEKVRHYFNANFELVITYINQAIMELKW